MALEAWQAFERSCAGGGGGGKLEEVQAKMPRRVKRRRQITTEDGTAAGLEEYYDYIFPEEGGKEGNLKLLEMAYKWKRQRTEEPSRAEPEASHASAATGL